MANIMREWLSHTGRKSSGLVLFFFINLTFAFVELLYGVWTNSLSFITDSFHMFYDCTALFAHLTAFIVAQWHSNDEFSYGYSRAEVLAGFVNCLFLLFISSFIFSEAIERIIKPQVVKKEHMLLVSLAGFILNLSGMIMIHASQYGSEGHHHVGCWHMGIILHMFADTLSSFGAIVSSILIQNFDLNIADPICSIVIAVMIASSVLVVMRESLYVLMQRTPSSLDHRLPGCYQQITSLDGVYNVYEPHFWALNVHDYIGTIKLEVAATANTHDILAEAHHIFSQIGVKDMCIEINAEEINTETSYATYNSVMD